jgi:hypothetical protein
MGTQRYKLIGSTAEQAAMSKHGDPGQIERTDMVEGAHDEKARVSVQFGSATAF